jgi:diguanylate cyclase (GGDEF)-like protein
MHNDPHTGLPMRSLLYPALERQLRRDGVALVVFDVDRMKHVNDVYGVAVGDAVLTQFATMLSQERPATSTAYRYGGEQFALVLPGDDVEAARRAAEQVRSRFERARLQVGHLHPLQGVTVRAGVSSLARSGDLQIDMLRLVDRVQSALEEAKSRGGNCVCVA